ncbi:MAG: hypothetical protein V4612_03195 [Pseudomonadota bacterium]
MHNQQILLEKYLSKSRLGKYAQIAQSDDLEKILEIYRLNIKYSEKFYSALIQFEVILRNAINQQLINDFGFNWFESESLNFTETQKSLINSVILDLSNNSKEINSCNVTSNLNFGFWINLFNRDYDKDDRNLWMKSLHKIFVDVENMPKRSLFRERLKNFHKLRNRISHCEPIVQFPLDKYYLHLIEFISWMSQELADWLEGEIEFNSIQKYQ